MCINGNTRKSLELKCGRPQFQDCGLQNPLLLSSNLQRKVTVVYICEKRWVKTYACFQCLIWYFIWFILPFPHALSHLLDSRVISCLQNSYWHQQECCANIWGFSMASLVLFSPPPPPSSQLNKHNYPCALAVRSVRSRQPEELGFPKGNLPEMRCPPDISAVISLLILDPDPDPEM